MSMSKIMSYLDLSVFPSIALVFFLIAFAAILWRVFTTTKQEINEAANIVLDDDNVVSPRARINTSTKISEQGVNHG